MLPSAIKAKYQKVFQINEGTELPESISKYFDRNGQYTYRQAQADQMIQTLRPYLENEHIY
ncbi:primosomal protein N' [Staphylococcus agnetis]|nr:primosomal protein N' [Staphylococcus agnetis]